nr:hypothetical protein Iba_chr04dCG12330 [Ipomoea batatas]
MEIEQNLPVSIRTCEARSFRHRLVPSALFFSPSPPRVSLGGLTPLRPNTFASHSAGALNWKSRSRGFPSRSVAKEGGWVAGGGIRVCSVVAAWRSGEALSSQGRASNFAVSSAAQVFRR